MNQKFQNYFPYLDEKIFRSGFFLCVTVVGLERNMVEAVKGRGAGGDTGAQR
jgi:hypothetical protein